MKSFCVAYAAGLVGILCLVLSAAGAVPVHNRVRTTRGFKNAALSTARGFGKRAEYARHDLDVEGDRSADMFGKVLRDRAESDSYPADWFAEELAGNRELARVVANRLADELYNNIELARLFTNKIIDQNMDGELTPDELLRTSY